MFSFEARQEIMLKLLEKRFDTDLCKKASTALMLILKEYLCIFDLTSENENEFLMYFHSDLQKHDNNIITNAY